MMMMSKKNYKSQDEIQYGCIYQIYFLDWKQNQPINETNLGQLITISSIFIKIYDIHI